MPNDTVSVKRQTTQYYLSISNSLKDMEIALLYARHRDMRRIFGLFFIVIVLLVAILAKLP